MVSIIQAKTTVQIDTVRELFREYEMTMDLDFCSRDLPRSWPGCQVNTPGPPAVYVGEKAAGCAALREPVPVK